MILISPKTIEAFIKVVSMSLGMIHVVTITSTYYDGCTHPIRISSALALSLPFLIFEILYETIKYCFLSQVTAPSYFPYFTFPFLLFVVITIETIVLDYFFDTRGKRFLESKLPSNMHLYITTGFSYFSIILQIFFVISFNLWFYGKIVYKNYSGPNINLSIPFLKV